MDQEVLTINGKQFAININKPFIFLAEDDMDDQELFAEAIALHNNSIQIQTVANGKKAIEFLEMLPVSVLPCLIVLDYNLPEADGAQILKRLTQQEHYKNVPKVVWSTSGSPVYREACLQLGAKAYFTKPGNISGIASMAKEMLTFSNCNAV